MVQLRTAAFPTQQFSLHSQPATAQTNRPSVHLSYDDLSPELKKCFLYYSLFPKGSYFIEDIAISMWISEGFVQPDERSESGQLDLEEIGVEYHQELVARNLLQPDESDSGSTSCTMLSIRLLNLWPG
jgi:hypothetical protein